MRWYPVDYGADAAEIIESSSERVIHNGPQANAPLARAIQHHTRTGCTIQNCVLCARPPGVRVNVSPAGLQQAAKSAISLAPHVTQ